MTSIRNLLAPVLAVSIAIAFFSCNSSEEKKDEKKEEVKEEKKPEEPVVAAFTPFKIIMVRHTVADFDKWKAGYMAHDSMRQAYGISHYVIGRGLDNPNWVVVVDKVADVQKAKDFSILPGLKDAMKKAGVTGKPEFSYAEVIRNDDTKIDQKERVMVAHHVKDFDTWIKAYDAEGKAKRMENGLLDRGMARGTEDPNMVYIVFAITDMAKAKARVNSPDLKKIMTDAGVDGPPKITYYKLVD